MGGAVAPCPRSEDASVVLELPSEARALRVVRAAFRDFAAAADAPLAAPDLDEVEVALHEACTNSIRHAHGGDAAKRFRVEMRRAGDGVEILVKDGGGPFSIDGAGPSPEALAEGGYGLSIVRSWMDEVSLAREDGGNVLRLLRRRRARPGGDVGPPV